MNHIWFHGFSTISLTSEALLSDQKDELGITDIPGDGTLPICSARSGPFFHLPDSPTTRSHSLSRARPAALFLPRSLRSKRARLNWTERTKRRLIDRVFQSLTSSPWEHTVSGASAVAVALEVRIRNVFEYVFQTHPYPNQLNLSQSIASVIAPFCRTRCSGLMWNRVQRSSKH